MKLQKRIFAFFLLLLLVLGFALKTWLQYRRSFFQKSLTFEIISPTFPQEKDHEGSAWQTLAYGYQLGSWPIFFQGNPVIPSMTYHPGPPEKFIPEMKMIWSPGNAEITIEGPRTPIEGYDAKHWKLCLENRYFCQPEKKRLVDATFSDLKKLRSRVKKIAWFEGKNYGSVNGLHVQIILESSQIDRYVLFNEKGITQNFTLTASRLLIGEEARHLFEQILGSMIFKNDLSEPRAVMAKKVQEINLQNIKSLQDPKLKYSKLIQIQNILFSELAIDPRSIAPFFHLAGVTHLLGVSLMREKNDYYQDQESWIIGTQPLLNALIKYVRDFPETKEHQTERAAALANMESLLQDFLLLESKSTQKIHQ